MILKKARIKFCVGKKHEPRLALSFFKSSQYWTVLFVRYSVVLRSKQNTEQPMKKHLNSKMIVLLEVHIFSCTLFDYRNSLSVVLQLQNGVDLPI